MTTMLQTGVYAGGQCFCEIEIDRVNLSTTLMTGPFNVAYNVSSRNILQVYAINVVAAVLGRSEKELEAQTIAYAKQGLIDPIENLKSSKVYVYQGGFDPVNPAS